MSDIAHHDPGRAPAQGTRRVRVTETLSRGLADRMLDVLGQQGERYRAGLREVLPQHARNKKTICRARQAFVDLGERTRLIQVIGSTANQRQVTVCQFVPHLIAGHGTQASALCFVLHQYVITRHGIRPGPDCGVALIAGAHAVERLFLRMNTLDPAAVVAELQDAMLLALPLWTVGLSLRLRQVALPTSSGTFLCDIDPDRRYLAAKTWIARPGVGARWASVVSALDRTVRASGGPMALAETLGTGIAQALDDDGSILFAQLAEALAAFPWLRDAYAPRPDVIGDAWKAHVAKH